MGGLQGFVTACRTAAGHHGSWLKQRKEEGKRRAQGGRAATSAALATGEDRQARTVGPSVRTERRGPKGLPTAPSASSPAPWRRPGRGVSATPGSGPLRPASQSRVACLPPSCWRPSEPTPRISERQINFERARPTRGGRPRGPVPGQARRKGQGAGGAVGMRAGGAVGAGPGGSAAPTLPTHARALTTAAPRRPSPTAGSGRRRPPRPRAPSPPGAGSSPAPRSRGAPTWRERFSRAGLRGGAVGAVGAGAGGAGPVLVAARHHVEPRPAGRRRVGVEVLGGGQPRR